MRMFLGGVLPSRNKIRNLFKNINKLGWLVITPSPIFGSNWNNGVKCGSRSSNWNNVSLNLNANISGRGFTVTKASLLFRLNQLSSILIKKFIKWKKLEKFPELV